MNHTFFAQNPGSIRFSNKTLVSKNILCSLQNRLQSVVAPRRSRNWYPHSFLRLSLWWSSLWRCIFHSDWCFVNHWPSFFDHSVIVPCLDWRRVSVGCENFPLNEERCCPFLQQQIVPIRVFDKRMDSTSLAVEYPRTMLRGSVSMLSRLLVECVVMPNTLSFFLRLDQCAHDP